jgi:hypothetical protein
MDGKAGATGGRTAGATTPHELLDASAHLASRTHGPRSRRFTAQRYDESGFPIAERRATFAARVRQLLRG